MIPPFASVHETAYTTIFTGKGSRRDEGIGSLLVLRFFIRFRMVPVLPLFLLSLVSATLHGTDTLLRSCLAGSLVSTVCVGWYTRVGSIQSSQNGRHLLMRAAYTHLRLSIIPSEWERRMAHGLVSLSEFIFDYLDLASIFLLHSCTLHLYPALSLIPHGFTFVAVLAHYVIHIRFSPFVATLASFGPHQCWAFAGMISSAWRLG